MMAKWISLLVFAMCIVGVVICWRDDSAGIILFTFAGGVAGALAYFEWRE